MSLLLHPSPQTCWNGAECPAVGPYHQWALSFELAAFATPLPPEDMSLIVPDNMCWGKNFAVLAADLGGARGMRRVFCGSGLMEERWGGSRWCTVEAVFAAPACRVDFYVDNPSVRADDHFQRQKFLTGRMQNPQGSPPSLNAAGAEGAASQGWRQPDCSARMCHA